MENDPPAYAQEEARPRKGRLMGKLFGRERKASNEQKDGDTNKDGDINDFLHGPSDTLRVAHAAPPPPPTLTRLDTLSAARYPNALQVTSASQQSLPLRTRSHSPRIRAKKGLVVRFVDTFPEIIGEGGDEAESPPSEIGIRKRAKTAPPSAPRRPTDVADQPRPRPDPGQPDDFAPPSLRRTQTGYSSIPDAPRVPAGTPTAAPFLDSPIVSKDDNRRSFIEVHQAEMREAEGLAFAKAVRSTSSASSHERDEKRKSPPAAPPARGSPEAATQPPPPPEPPEARLKKPPREQSPASVHSTSSSLAHTYSSYRQNTKLSDKEATSPSSPLKASMSLQDAGDDALNVFVARTRHLFELFRLQSEAMKPLLSRSADDLARAALWWFLQGRWALEGAVRDQPSTPQAQRANEMARQQAYADLAKGYWISEDVLPGILDARRSPVDGEVDEVRRSLLSNIRKLCGSMQRNGFLPPEDPFLPQTIDKAIWVEYPAVSQDVVALLWGSWGSALGASQRPTPPMSLLESLPLGDTGQEFSFGRVPADIYLMEQGREEQQRFYFPCMLSMIRPLTQTDLVFVITSQNGAVQLRIQHSKTTGATWDDVRWRPDINAIDLKLPRGFKLGIQLSQQDYRLLWSMYDFGSKVQGTLYPRKDEQASFRSTLKAFQYFDSDPQSRQFPKEPVPDCEVGLFERILHEGAATGPRSYHRGFRVAVVTGTKTRTLCGVNHPYIPQVPVQFGFLRGEQDDPALLLKFDTGRSKGSMVLTFGEDKERLRFHSLLIGTALQHDEHIFSEVPLMGMTLSQSSSDATGVMALKRLPYQRVRVINDEDGTDSPPTVLAEKLRMVVEFKNGTITDRVNVAPGELKMRLQVADPTTLTLLRQPQLDMTIAVSEAQVPRELCPQLVDALKIVAEGSTCRSYKFGTLKDLHEIQAALTGFKVIFDGIAATFAISRRRMVVPIHKKWEAGATRIQVVQQDKVTQLLAFFKDFHHGESMGFVLKGTDVYEAFSRSGKFGLKIDDAKFPLPKTAKEGGGDEAAFVCLDLPDLPGEHDDITIVFESEADRDQLISRLPATVKNHRLSWRH